MTMTTVIVLNAVLSVAVLGALALVYKLAHRLPQARLAETLHPSRPISLEVVRYYDDLPRAA